MSFREDSNEEGRDLKKPLLHTGSWYRMASRQSSLMTASQMMIRESSISVVACVLIVALGPIQFGFTVYISLSSSLTISPDEINRQIIKESVSTLGWLYASIIHGLLTSSFPGETSSDIHGHWRPFLDDCSLPGAGWLLFTNTSGNHQGSQALHLRGLKS